MPKFFGLFMLAGLLGAPLLLRADDQTSTVSPVETGGLPFSIELQTVDLSSSMPETLQSYAMGSLDGDWVFVAGRTNGLHNFTGDGLLNFPPADQNEDIVVINPVTQQTWSRSITTSDLDTTEMNALTSTSPEFTQNGSTLYVAGGYLYDGSNFTTYDTLTALDLPGVINWVQTGTGSLASNVRQTSDPTLQVTGGNMATVGGKTLLSFGQDFEGPYTPAFSGSYTEQVRSFDIVDSGTSLSIANISASAQLDTNRRRDLNIVPLVGTGTGGAKLVALSGVFTDSGGAWTVPVEISASGSTSMADANAPGTFKQAMNNYAAPTISMYSDSTGDNHIVVLGGISLQTNISGTFTTDEELPFTSQSTDIVRDAEGNYTQYYLGDPYPDIIDSSTGEPLLFGAGAQFMLNPDLALVDGAIDMDALTGPTLLGWVFGGIAAQQANDGATAGSNELFGVWYTPTDIPEPGTTGLLFGAGALAFWRVRRRLVSPA